MIDLTVKTLDSQNHAFSLDDDQITVRGFKEYIAESVAVPADSQRLIYCGRVLQDEKKLNDYDVNGKVIHLVQRAPPQHGQRGNNSGQAQGQGQDQGAGRQNQRSQFRFTRTQTHPNAMYMGTMSLPAEIVDGHVLPVPPLSNTLSNSRLLVARRMLDRCNEVMDHLDDPDAPLSTSTPVGNQTPLTQEVHVQEIGTDVDGNGEGPGNVGARLATAAAIAAVLQGAENVTVLRGNSEEVHEPRNESSNDSAQGESQGEQQSQSEQGTASNSEGQANRRPLFPRPPQMAELLDRLLSTQDRLRPYIERYRVLMLADPSLPPGDGPDGVEENQTVVDRVSEGLHFLSHACHALSDIIVDMEQEPPRNLRCRPIIIQHSAILQAGIPIHVEARISLYGRNGNNNNGNEETNDSAGAAAQSETTETTEPVEVNIEGANQPGEGESANQGQSTRERPAQADQTQTPFGRVGGSAAGVFPWGSAPPPDFIRNLMQVVAGHMVQNGIATTTITTRTTPATAGQQTTASTMESANATGGQSTVARSNVGTHPTTATQTRSTSRPHVFHQHTHPLSLGLHMNRVEVEFDPFLSCNSHHVRRISSTIANTTTTTATSTTTTSQTTRTSQAPVQETQTQSQPAMSATTSSSSSSRSSSSSSGNVGNALRPPRSILSLACMHLINLLNRNVRNDSNSNVTQISNRLVRRINMETMGFLDDSGLISRLKLSTLIGLRNSGTDFTQVPVREEDILEDLLTLIAQKISFNEVISFILGQWEPLVNLRRPLIQYFQHLYPSASTPELLQEQVTERLLLQLRPHLRDALARRQDTTTSNYCVDVCATVERILGRHIRDVFKLLFDDDVDNSRFGQELFNIINELKRQICIVLRYGMSGGLGRIENLFLQFSANMLQEMHPYNRQLLVNVCVRRLRDYFRRIPVPSESDINLAVYENPPEVSPSAVSPVANQVSPTRTESEPMETEPADELPNIVEASMTEDNEEIPETFPGHEALPSAWVPIIARDGVRQRRQLQGTATGDVTPFSDAYLGSLPSKRRKLIEQQKPRLLVSPAPNHSAITASMERLVREGVSRAGVEEVEGAAVAVAADPGVRRAFGQAIRDCLTPHRYGTPDFPDPLRFPNATKYFADQEKPPK